MITLLICLAINSLLSHDEPKQDQPKQEKLLYVGNDCLLYWKEHGKETETDSLLCFSITLLKAEIDSITYMRQDLEADTTKLTTYKKVGRKLFFKNAANPEYQLFFDFENQKGGYIIRPNRGIHEMNKFKIVCTEKIKYKDKYLYRLRYKPVGFSSTENWAYYYDEDGECVIIEGGFLFQYYLRIDYFDRKLRHGEDGKYYFETD
jgi:hypothetical protein